MKSANQPRFDVTALRKLAGDTVYARGRSYHQDGAVQLLAIEPKRVLAAVSGSEDYTVILTGRGTAIKGECSCPAFSDYGFCKHMVAAALAVNAAGDEEPGSIGALSRIRVYLKAKGADALVDMLLELAERDPALFRKFDMAAAPAQEDGKTLENRLRKALDSVTRTHGFIGYREAPGWAAGVEDALDTIAGLTSGSHAGLALKLAERAIERIEMAINEMDDSDGHCGALLEQAAGIHLAAARTCRPSPGEFARTLFFREMKDGYGAFDGAVRQYADVLGDDGLAEYCRLAAAAWSKLPPRVAGPKQQYEYSSEYSRLTGILDFFAERDGDLDARIALRAKDLSSAWSYYQLAEFCRSQGREEEALKWAEEGLWLFEDGRTDERLLFLTADLLAKAGRKPDAATHLWRTFEKQPSLALYERLRKLGGKAACTRAVTFLEARCTKEPGSRWGSPADLLVQVLMKEKQLDAAWKAVRQYGASMGVKETLARTGEAAWPREALEVYAERTAQLVEGGGNQAYEQAVKLIAHMAKLHSAAEHTAYILEIKARFNRKRNFMKLLG